LQSFGFKGVYKHESFTIHSQALREVQNCQAQSQVVCNLRKPKT
jgi:hypothetical protein